LAVSSIVLRAEAIVAGYDGPPVLDGVSVAAEAGKIAVVLGPNGAGKSTLAKAIVGLVRPKSGRVYLRDQDVTGQGPHLLVRQGVAYLPQLLNFFDRLSVIENLEMGGYTVKGSLRKRIADLMEIFPDLQKDKHKRSGTLSGGQQRMLALARMLMTDPTVAILDEPSAGLSPLYAERVWSQIARIAEFGVALLVIEQNATMAMDRADNVFLLAQGRNVIQGPAGEIRHRAEVARILVG
jgi:ABC-type branched-subunit amino acid transport system ATPase component